MIRKLFLLFVSILIVTVILVPRQSDYFKRLENDFGKTHHAAGLDASTLKGMGEYVYTNNLIYSQFQYSFGNISVSYYGFLNFILFKGSKIKDSNNSKVVV